jgi:predicted O-methyltransferase YrrM
MIDISKAEKIEGWMSNRELTWLSQQAQNHRTVVEVGSYFGRSARAIGDHVLGTLVAVDTWVGPIALNTPNVLPSFEQKFRANLADLIASKKVVAVTPTSAVLDDLEPDMVFIDGNHQYSAVKKDIQFWLPKIIKGGLLCGHDFSCLDVGRAVGELVAAPQSVPDTDLWFAYV